MSKALQTPATRICQGCGQPFTLLEVTKTEPAAIKGRTLLWHGEPAHKAALVRDVDIEEESGAAEEPTKPKKARKKKDEATPETVTAPAAPAPAPAAVVPGPNAKPVPEIPAGQPSPIIAHTRPPAPEGFGYDSAGNLVPRYKPPIAEVVEAAKTLASPPAPAPAPAVTKAPETAAAAQLPVPVGKYSMQEFQEGLEGSVNVALPQIKIIHQGGMFELPNGSQPVQSFDGILLLSRSGLRRLFLSAYNPSSPSAPDCSSFDGKEATRPTQAYQVGNPQQSVNVFGSCRSCYFNNWSTGIGMNNQPTKGKRCGEYTLLFLLIEGSMMPVVLQIAPTGLKTWSESLSTSIVRNIPPARAMWRFTARRSGNGMVTEVVGNILRELDPNEIAMRTGIFQSANPYLLGYIDRFVTGAGSGEQVEVVAVQ